MTDIKRLHEVHYQYPNVPRRGGKTRYCLDRLLRTAQLGELKNICYISNKMDSSMDAFANFVKLLINEKITFRHKQGIVWIDDCIIQFESLETIKNKPRFDSGVYDLY